MKRRRRVERWVGLAGACLLCAVSGCGRPTPQPPVQTIVLLATSSPTIPHETASAPLAPSPAYPGTYIGTPTPSHLTAQPVGEQAVESYVVQPGETLSQISLVFGCTVDEIVTANGLADANSLSVGQTLYIPVAATETGPYLKLVPDSEMVYGPAYVHFDLVGFIAQQGGYLAGYTEQVEGWPRTGTEIVQMVAQRFSVGPRVLLALLEHRSGWVTQPQPVAESMLFPLGYVQSYHEGLFQQLSWAAVKLNEGYYGWKWGDRTTVRLSNGVRATLADGLNPGTAGVQNCLAELSGSWEEWIAQTGPQGFAATYQLLFGNPFAYTVEPLVPPDLVQPELRLPWEAGRTWYLTGGPHGGWGNGSGRAALDFVPDDKIPDCTVSGEWVVAAAPGLVVRSEYGEVVVDLDGDGFEQSGWVLLYMHVHSQDRVAAGTTLARGQPIGHPSCEGGYADASHLHFARRYNGEWIPAGKETLPMVLSGWMAHEDLMPYEGTMTRGDQVRTARECWDDAVNGLVSDNGP